MLENIKNIYQEMKQNEMAAAYSISKSAFQRRKNSAVGSNKRAKATRNAFDPNRKFGTMVGKDPLLQ